MKRFLSLLLVLTLMSSLLVSCEKSNSGDETGNNSSENLNTSGSIADSVENDSSQIDTDMFTNRDLKADYDENDSVLIQLNGNSATASSNSVQISGSTVTITEDATYIISGTLNDGMIIVNAPDTAKMQLVLNGVNINSKVSAPLYILEADKVFITLADGTENTLSNGGTFTAMDDSNIDAAVFSKQDITFNGTGSLTVTSPAGHGIASKDDLVITGGTYTVICASHGLDANDSVRVTGKTSITVDAGKDGIHVENSDDTTLGFVYIANGSMKIESEGDGISAGAYMQIENGTIDILAGGGSENGTKSSSDSWGGFMGGGRPGQPSPSTTSTEDSTSMKGLKAISDILISNGTFTINSADDAIHSNVSVIMTGGNFEIASGDDAVHAEEDLTVTAGTIHITESYEGLEALNVLVQGGDIKLVASDDGLNAAGGTDSSGTIGGRDGMFGGPGDMGGGPGGMGGNPGGMGGNPGGMGGNPGGMGGNPGGMGGNPDDMGGGMSSFSNGSIVISGGNLYVSASGDGLDANGTLTISGGYTTVVGPTQGDTATLDYDVSGVITGGTFIGTGASGMAQTFSSSEQGVVAVSTGNQSAGTSITLQDKDGNTMISYAPELPFQVVILSSPDIASGETYTITVGSNSCELKAN